MFGKYFVMVKLTVSEAQDKKDLENAGASTWLEKLGGANAGIPFFAILSADGKTLGDSLIMPGKQNVGYPGQKDEIAAFVRLLRKAAPKMSAKDASAIETAFNEAAKKLKLQ